MSNARICPCCTSRRATEVARIGHEKRRYRRRASWSKRRRSRYGETRTAAIAVIACPTNGPITRLQTLPVTAASGMVTMKPTIVGVA
jgi:ribosomal protein L32